MSENSAGLVQLVHLEPNQFIDRLENGSLAVCTVSYRKWWRLWAAPIASVKIKLVEDN